MDEKEMKQEGEGWVLANEGNLQGFLEQPKRKSYSVVAMNLETLEDVEDVIRRCCQIKTEMELIVTRERIYKQLVERCRVKESHGMPEVAGVVGVCGPKECGDWTVGNGGPAPCKIPCKDPEGRPLYMGSGCPHSWIK